MNSPEKSAATASHVDLASPRESPYGTSAEPTYSGALSFLRRRYSKDLDGVDVAVVGVPFDLATTNRPGTRLGPRGIRAASASLAWCRPYAWDFDPFDRANVVDWGDVFFDSGQPAKVPDAICNAYRAFMAAGPLSLIHFDAHCDTWRDNEGRIDHGTMFYHAARRGFVDPSRSIQVGMRTHNDESHGYQVLDARWLHAHGAEACIEEIRDRVGEHPCYVSFDIDFLDPSCAPGTGTPVVGGFDTNMALRLVRGPAGFNIVGADVVGVPPPSDG